MLTSNKVDFRAGGPPVMPGVPEDSLRPSEDPIEHGLGEEPGLGVSLARMVRRKEADRRKVPCPTMAKLRQRGFDLMARRFPCAQKGSHRGGPEDDDDLGFAEENELPIQVGLSDLFRGSRPAVAAPHG